MTPAQMEAGLNAGAAELGLALTPLQQQKLLQYLALIQKWNRVYNLTAVRDSAEMLTHHLLDCLAVVAPLQDHLSAQGLATARLLDVGAGAGLPGVVLAICLPQLHVDCVDTVAKKAAFIQQVAGELALPNLRGLHARVENLQEPPYNVVSSRAFSSLADLVRLTLFHVKQGGGHGEGVWMAMKGKNPQDELAALPAQAGVLRVQPLRVPGLEAERCLVWLAPANPGN
jgi:16S rRNA (guanine527-N7)-methyltransferase